MNRRPSTDSTEWRKFKFQERHMKSNICQGYWVPYLKYIYIGWDYDVLQSK
jgi:hypothetical protein